MIDTVHIEMVVPMSLLQKEAPLMQNWSGVIRQLQNRYEPNHPTNLVKVNSNSDYELYRRKVKSGFVFVFCLIRNFQICLFP